MATDTFGDRLKTEREDRGLTIEAVAEIVHVDQAALRALERNDFAALPNEAVMKDCLHAYAECLDVDAELMIADYDQERETHQRRLEDAVLAQAPKTAPAAVPIAMGRRQQVSPRLSPRLVVLAVVAIVVLAAWWILSRDGAAPAPEARVSAAPGEQQAPPSETPASVAPAPAPVDPVEPPAGSVEPRALSSKARKSVASTTPEDSAPLSRQPTSSKPPAEAASTSARPPTSRSAPTTPAPQVLSITDYGLGTAVVDRQLVGRSDRFTAGTQVCFWTRVQGGGRGERVDHVWLREGVEAMRHSLKIGASSWRTYSAMTLPAGVGGVWAVEARDAAGRVLARSEFVSVR